MNIALYVLQLLLNIYIFITAFRFILQTVRADYYNPIVQVIVKLTDPLSKPFQRFLPFYKNISTGLVILLFLLEVIRFCLFLFIAAMPFNIFAILIVSLVNLFDKFLNLYFYLIVLRAIFSWLGPRQVSPFSIILYQVTEPILAPARRIIPPISGIDLSPVLVLIILQVLSYALMQLIML